ncbi:hypothetical protein BC829DRAFT_384281 [Chytridium lagenaria]|nr:hypothetical protein BC829DRAFT_384281 [Chytridium lagenaria]
MPIRPLPLFCLVHILPLVSAALFCSFLSSVTLNPDTPQSSFFTRVGCYLLPFARILLLRSYH